MQGNLRWAACYTRPTVEHKVRSGIEAEGFGAFLPTFARVWYAKGHKFSREQPLLTRYVLVQTDDSERFWNVVRAMPEVHSVLMNAGAISGVKGEEVAGLMLAHATGAYNVIQARDNAGRFARKHRHRRRRPRHGKRYGVSHQANTTAESAAC
jgi:transcription antitermination factor NusG